MIRPTALRRRASVLVGAFAVVAACPGWATAQQVGPTVTASGAAIWDPADDELLFGREAEVGRPMASTTKIMTVLLALEDPDAGETLVVSANAAGQGEASLGLRAGQQLPLDAVLAGLMLRSGNDAAVAVAEHVAGGEAAFVELMNARARELGLTATAFVNPSGLTNDPGHHASPLDLARLAEAAMANAEFAGWAGAPRLNVPPFGPLDNRNLLLVRYEGATGVKTGNTRLAGWCLVASATRDGRTLFAVVLDSATSDASFDDVARLLDHGFTAFRRPQPVIERVPVMPYRWAGAAVPLVPSDTLADTVPVAATTTWRTILNPDVDLPVRPGAVLGRAELLVDGEVTRTTRLRAAAQVPALPPRSPATTAGAAVHDAVRAFARTALVERVAA